MLAAAIVGRTAAIVGLAAGASAAELDTARPGAYLGLGATYAFHWFHGEQFDDNLGGEGVQVLSSGSAGLNATAGYRVTSWLATELEYEWTSGFGNEIDGYNVTTLGSHTVTLNAKWLYPGWGRVQPYVLGGLGLSIWEARHRKTVAQGLAEVSLGGAGRIGLGADVYLDRRWLVRLGLEVVASTTTIDNSLGRDLRNLFYVPIQLGVQYRF